MTDLKKLEVAVVGGRELVTGMRLAGMSRYYLIEGEGDIAAETRKALGELVDDASVATIILQEDYVDYVADIVDKIRGSRRATPVIIEVPSKYGTKYPDVKSYYKAFIRKFIGFDAEL